MIKFNPEKITFEYVYIRKIFKTFVEVISDNERNPYKSETVEYKRLKDGCVQIPIHYKVYALYLKTNSILHFDENIGKKACITFYDGKVLSIDVYRKNYFSEPEPEATWKSVNEGVFSHIKGMLEIQEDIYIDGESIFLVDKLSPIQNFKNTKSFWVQPVRYIALSKMGVKKYTSKLLNDLKNDTLKSPEEKEKELKKENDSTVILRSGYVLAYNPNKDFNENDNSIIVYSPVFDTGTANISKNKKDNNKSEAEQRQFFKNLQNIENKDDPTILNLNFVLKAARVIGEHYSFDETDFLDIPALICETNIINLKTDISINSRATYPVDIPVWDGLAYIMRFCYQESNLNIYRDLVSLFRFTLVRGFVSKKETGDLFNDGKGMGDIKYFKIGAFNKARKADKILESV